MILHPSWKTAVPQREVGRGAPTRDERWKECWWAGSASMFPCTLASGVQTSNDRRRATSRVGSRLPSPGRLSTAPHLSPLHLLYKSFTLIKGPFVAFPKPPHTMKAPPGGLCTLDAFHFCSKCTLICSFSEKLSKLQLCRRIFERRHRADWFGQTGPLNTSSNRENEWCIFFLKQQHHQI